MQIIMQIIPSIATLYLCLLSILITDIGPCSGETDPTSFREPEMNHDDLSFDITNFPLGTADPVLLFLL